VTVFDLRCDRCGTMLLGPAEDADPSGPLGIRFLYHPGDFFLKDDSGMLCGPCWSGLTQWLGAERPEGSCAVCHVVLEHALSLHLHRSNDPYGWQLCKPHAVEFLNGLRTVEPKLDPATFTLAGDWKQGRYAEGRTGGERADPP
jgi:hypothetical protein